MKFDSKSCSYRIRQGINLSKKRKLVDNKKPKTFNMSIRSNFLLVPNLSNSNVNIVISSKVIRIE